MKNVSKQNIKNYLKQKESPRKRTSHIIAKFIVSVACIGILFTNSLEAKADNLYVCTEGGDVTATYETVGEQINGYYRSGKNVIVSYSVINPNQGCHQPESIGITDHVVINGGHHCNGHTSNSAQWVHIYGAAGPRLFGIESSNLFQIKVTEEEYKSCSYVIGGQKRSFGDGLSDGMTGWVTCYRPLPGTIFNGSQTDMEAPGITLTAAPYGEAVFQDKNGKKWGKTARITVTATDNKSKPDFLHPFRWKKAETQIQDWGKTGQFVFAQNNMIAIDSMDVTENAQYAVMARDGLGNSTDWSKVSVNCIDISPPIIHKMGVDKENWTDGDAFVTVDAVDSSVDQGGCGLPEKPYSWDDGKNWTQAPFLLVQKTGTYKVVVRDGLGNEVTESLSVVKKEVEKKLEAEPEPEPTPIPTPPNGPDDKKQEQKEQETIPKTPDPVTPIVVPVIPDTPTPPEKEIVRKKKQTSDSLDVPEKTPEVKKKIEVEEKETVELPKYYSENVKKEVTVLEKKDTFKNIMLVVVLACLIAFLLLILFLLWLFAKTYVLLFAEKEKGVYKWIGILKIQRKEDQFLVQISDETLQKVVSKNYRIQVFPTFYQLHKEEKLWIHFEEKSIRKSIDRIIEFSI